VRREEVWALAGAGDFRGSPLRFLARHEPLTTHIDFPEVENADAFQNHAEIFLRVFEVLALLHQVTLPRGLLEQPFMPKFLAEASLLWR
jgi:hypothetical protein